MNQGENANELKGIVLSISSTKLYGIKQQPSNRKYTVSAGKNYVQVHTVVNTFMQWNPEIGLNKATEIIALLRRNCHTLPNFRLLLG